MSRNQIRASALAAAAFLVAVALAPETARAAINKDQRTCQSKAAKAANRLFADRMDALADCHDAIGDGTLAPLTDCLAASTAALDAADAEFVSAATEACPDAVVASLLYGGDCEDIATGAELTACVGAAHRSAADALVAAIYGSPSLPSGSGVKCRAKTSGHVRKYASKALKTLEKCKDKASSEKVPFGTRCEEDARTTAKLAKLAAKVAKKVSKICTDVASGAFGSPCDLAGTVEDLSACLVAAADAEFAGPTVAAYGDGGFCGDSANAVEGYIDSFLPGLAQFGKFRQMAGDPVDIVQGWPTPELPSQGIPGYHMVDGPRGVTQLVGNATAFPVGMARGATWDEALEEAIGEAVGRETRAYGASVILAPVTTVVRHPRWGRSQESYGEDPVHLGAMGTAFVRGAQRHVVASLKHFAVNSIEDTRFTVNVTVDERTLREIYLPHFRRVVTEGQAASVMSAYNKVNGQYCAENSHLLRDILKGEWGFRGFVESDWVFGTRSTVASALAGLDIEMPSPNFYSQQNLAAAVTAGDIPIEVIDEAVRRNLRVKMCFDLRDNPPAPDPAAVETAEAIALARQAAREAIVLLENDGDLLPLDPSAPATIVVTGPLADAENIGDLGSSAVAPSYVVTALEGIQAAAGSATVVYLADEPGVGGNAATIAAADAVIVVAGFTSADEGEAFIAAGDRDTYSLDAAQEAWIADVAALNPATVVVLEGGSAIGIENWVDDVEALLMAWYPGMEGGTALGEILFGAVNPSGKLPLVWAADEADLPTFVNDNDEVTYEYYHGYRRLDHNGADPRYPFGHGLSYADYSYSNLVLEESSLAPEGTLALHFDVTNNGTVAGEEVAQLYVGYPGSAVDRPIIELKNFARVALEPGETRTVDLEVPVADLAYYEVSEPGWVVEEIAYGVHVGGSSRDLPLSAGFTVAP